MALHGHQHPVLTRPPGEHPPQRGEEHIVDLRPVHPGHPAQQPVGDLAVQRHAHGVGGPGGGRTGTVHRKVRATRPPYALPVREIGVQLALPYPLAQPMGPGGEGGGGGLQAHRLPGGGLPVGALQIAQQNAPRDAVHGQVVHGEEQPRPGPGPAPEQGAPQQRPRGQVEFGAGGFGLRLGRGRLLRATEPGQLVAAQYRPARRAVPEVPPSAVVTLEEPGTQGRVVRDHGVQRGLQRALVQVGRQLEDHRHGEVAQRAVGGEEPVLDRGERRRALRTRFVRGGFGRAARCHGGGQLGDGLVQEDIP
ncbi:hypothetical protein GCM10009575_019610 [Streptomyces rhizosphaericus]|uniref:Uncharacterized protein n=1 Tax=Streptomyces rhizosphaericus TaxID=114699 RepID=A0ABP3ZLE0_9ACTN